MRNETRQVCTIASIQPQTLAGFRAVIDVFVNESIRPTDLADEQHYLQMCHKPPCLNCATLLALIEYLNKLLSVFPGAGRNPQFQTLVLKNMYYRMMPDPWKRSFLNSSQMLTDPKNTLLDLQRYMSLQEDQHQMMTPRQSSGMTEFRQPIQVQSHLEMSGILVQLGRIQHT